MDTQGGGDVSKRGRAVSADGGSERPIRVLIVDDSALVRNILRRVLSAEPGIEVV